MQARPADVRGRRCIVVAFAPYVHARNGQDVNGAGIALVRQLNVALHLSPVRTELIPAAKAYDLKEKSPGPPSSDDFPLAPGTITLQ